MACGWCDRPGFPICMNKNDAEKGGCHRDSFIHQWRELNKCPKVTLVSINIMIAKLPGLSKV